jgi:hypothetical protein
MKRSQPERVRALRNTRTLNAYQARLLAAQRAAMPFLFLPTIFNPAIAIPLLPSAIRHGRPWAAAVGVLLWVTLAGASLTLGFLRHRRYLREHPFVEW